MVAVSHVGLLTRAPAALTGRLAGARKGILDRSRERLAEHLPSAHCPPLCFVPAARLAPCYASYAVACPISIRKADALDVHSLREK